MTQQTVSLGKVLETVSSHLKNILKQTPQGKQVPES